MSQNKNGDLKHALPTNIGKPAFRALSAAGYTSLEQFTKLKEADLLKLHGFGPKAFRLIRNALKDLGLSFAVQNNNLLMKSNSKVFDSPIGWVKSHIKDYVETDGKKGHSWRGLPTLLLTTVGRRSGKLRQTALIYGRDGNDYLVVASNGGAIHHPKWYLNLVKTPTIEVQVGADKFTAQARTAPAAEKTRLWQLMTKIFAQYEEYQTKASKAGRDIPLVILKQIENKSRAEV